MGRLEEALRKCSLYHSCILLLDLCPRLCSAITCICTTGSDRGTNVVGERIKAFEQVESKVLYGTALEVLRYHGNEHRLSFET